MRPRGFAQRRTATWQQIAALRGRLTRELRAPLPQSARLAAETRALVRAGRDRLARATLDVERLGAALALLNPEAVLDRGYAIVTASGGDLTVKSEVGKGATFTLTLPRAE